jgi:hypothetical protein
MLARTGGDAAPMIDFLAQLVVQLGAELVPRRASGVLASLTALVCGLGLLGLAAFGVLSVLSR